MSERDEVLLKMMLSAEKDYHDTKKDYEGAKHDLTLEWKLVHPHGLVSDLLGYLQARLVALPQLFAILETLKVGQPSFPGPKHQVTTEKTGHLTMEIW
ncbi:hypothetical protein HDU79_009062 [Rhizoclosmatium sp. JEL0117]|nr:hypothetical protein HDU79_009062 [Rhizoclosmatium sp. JEL0117]